MSISAPALPDGFRYAGVACGIKPSGKPDLSLIVSERPVVAAGVYTRNQVVAAPVQLSRPRTPTDSLRAVVANSGNANACTGHRGSEDAAATCRRVAERVGCDESDVLVMSTGVIGQWLPMDRVEAGIDDAYGRLSAESSAFEAAADAILTTDRSRKVAFREVAAGDRRYRIAAMAKGAGMIAPNMATMLAVVLTDAPLDPGTAQRLLAATADGTFNRVSVDGHTSTNDSLLLLSGGRGEPLAGESLDGFAAELSDASLELAKSLVADGEGARHFFEVRVVGAADRAAADRIAQTVAASPLVKTAVAGDDPNWGRIVSAAGYADAVIDPHGLSLKICDTSIYRDGGPLPVDAEALSATMTACREVRLELTVGRGPGEATRWASDLTTDYVELNSKYTT